MRITDRIFVQALEAVPGSYDDFVSFLVRNVTADNERQMVLEYLKEHPEANAGDVLGFHSENLWNESDDYDEDTVFYDWSDDSDRPEGGYKRWKVDYSVLPLKGELISDAFILQSADVGSAFRWSQAFLADKYPPETVREVVIWDIGMMNHNVFTKGNVDVILDIPADEEWRIHTLIDEQDLFVECATEESLEQGKIRVRLCGVKQHIDLLKSLFQE